VIVTLLQSRGGKFPVPCGVCRDASIGGPFVRYVGVRGVAHLSCATCRWSNSSNQCCSSKYHGFSLDLQAKIRKMKEQAHEALELKT
jgi:hypothetical protein